MSSVSNRIFVANIGSNNVTIVDGATNLHVIDVSTGTAPAAVIVNALTDRVYVANSGASTLTMINGAVTINSTAGSVTVGTNPVAVGINPVTNRLVSANSGSANATIVDCALHTQTGLQGLSIGTPMIELATNKIYKTNWGDAKISVFDGVTNAQSFIDNVPMTRSDGELNPVTHRLYVTDFTAGKVRVIDTLADTHIADITVDGGNNILVDHVNNKVYCQRQTVGTWSVFDGTSHVVTPLPAFGTSNVALDPKTHRIFNTGSNQIKIFDSDTYELLDTIAYSSAGLARIDPVGRRLYVVGFNFAASVPELKVFDCDTLAELHAFQIPDSGSIQSVDVDAVFHRYYQLNLNQYYDFYDDGAGSYTQIIPGRYHRRLLALGTGLARFSVLVPGGRRGNEYFPDGSTYDSCGYWDS